MTKVTLFRKRWLNFESSNLICNLSETKKLELVILINYYGTQNAKDVQNCKGMLLINCAKHHPICRMVAEKLIDCLVPWLFLPFQRGKIVWGQDHALVQMPEIPGILFSSSTCVDLKKLTPKWLKLHQHSKFACKFHLNCNRNFRDFEQNCTCLDQAWAGEKSSKMDTNWAPISTCVLKSY